MPAQIEDPSEDQLAVLVRLASTTTIVASILYCVLSVSVIDASSFNYSLVAVGVAVSVVALALVRAGLATRAAALLLGTLIAIAIAATALGGGSRSPAYDVFFVAILLGGFFFGARAALGIGLFSLCATGAIAVLESTGGLPEARYPISAGMRWTTLMTSIVAVSGTMWLGLRQAQRNFEAVRRSEAQYRLVTDDASDFVWTLDAERVFTFASPSVERILGYRPEHLVGRKWRREMLVDGLPDVEALVLEAIAEHQEILRYEAHHVRADGKSIWCEVSNKLLYDAKGRLTGVTGITRDISERKAAEERERELERQFRESQRLEAVGKLAGGIAHDFNNYLTVIMGNAEMIMLDESTPPDTRVDEIQEAASQSAALTQQLLAFSRRQILQPTVLDLNEQIREVDRLLRRVLGEDVALETRLTAELGPIRADSSQIQQIILNLALNARTAMPDGGRLDIETSELRIDATTARDHPDVDSGDYVRLVVRDTGTGIDSEHLPRIFEPFFTTRREGSGLGLATVHGIVKQSGGAIEVASEAGRGSTFTVYLPRVDDAVDDAMEEEQVGHRSTMSVEEGSETLLLVEDLEPLRRLTRRQLEGQGYSVLVAADAEEALEIVERDPERIDLLVSDVVLPGLSGIELSRQLRERYSIPAVLVTGFSEDQALQGGAIDPDTLLLTKPFTAREIGALLREAIDRVRD